MEMGKNGGNSLKIAFLKLKNFIIKKFGIFVLVFGIMMISSGICTYDAYRVAGYEVQEKLVSSYTQYGVYTYTVPVTEANPLYTKGTTLEMGKPAYFLTVSPTVDVSFMYRLESTGSADVNVEREIMIVAKSKKVAGEKEKIFWQKEFPLKSEGFDKIKNGEMVTSNFSLNISEIQTMVKGMQDHLKYSQDATIEVVTHVNYDGKINGEDVEGTKEFTMPLLIASSYYQIPEELEFSEETNTYKKFRVKKDPSLSTLKTPLLLFLFSIVLIGIILPFMNISAVEPTYIEKLEKERRYSSFKEFISKGKLPEKRGSLLEVEISSLQELIDAAIDTNSRVIYDQESETYFMLHNNALYTFL